jgi:chaperonin GroES
MASKIRPIDDRIVVQVSDAEAQSVGGIILPDSAQERPQRGKVTAVGNGKQLENGNRAELSVKTGDMVIFGKYAGTDVEVSGNEYKILRESDILARVE